MNIFKKSYLLVIVTYIVTSIYAHLTSYETLFPQFIVQYKWPKGHHIREEVLVQVKMAKNHHHKMTLHTFAYIMPII